MEGVEFEQDNINYTYNNMTKNQKGSAFARFLVKKGVVKNETQANIIMLVLGVVFIITSVFLIMKSLKGKTSEVRNEIPDEVLQRFSPEVQEALSKQSK